MLNTDRVGFDRFNVEYLTKDTPPLETVNADEKICDAIRKMCRNNYSQLPIIRKENGRRTCIGVVTALSLLRVIELQFEKGDNKGINEILQFPVARFKVPDEPTFARPDDEILDYIDDLAREDFVLMGSRDKCDSIVTNSDVVNFFRNKTEIFLLLREIETSLRYVVSKCLSGEGLREALASIETRRKARNISAPLHDIHDLSFEELKAIINKGWDRFGKYFKEKRKTNDQLEYIRGLRNKIFHFRSQITVSELTHIRKLRNNLIRMASGMLEG